MADLTKIVRGVDVSHHQSDIDVGSLPVRFVIARTAQAKGGQYGTTIDRFYSQHKANALRAGKMFSSYLYLGNGLSAADNAALHAACEPDRKVPLMVDWEQGSGNGSFLRSCVRELQRAGYGVWGTYAPRWYWASQGSPDLSGLPPLVSSRYPDNQPGGFDREYLGTPESYWLGYGGNTVRMLQFSSVVRFSQYPGRDIDGDAFIGTDADLARWWDPDLPNPTPKPADLNRGEELMERITVTPPDGNEHNVRVNLSGAPGAAVVVRPRIDGSGFSTPMWVGHIFAWGNDKQGVGHDPAYIPGYDPKLTSHRRYELPGAVWADIRYSAAEPFDIDIVG